jgi:DNA-binding transcriptional MerR regulator
MLPIEQRRKILELRSKGMTLAQIRDMVKEMFHRNTLSMQTCLNVIKKDNP